MVYQMANPWTQEGRRIEIEKGVAEVYARYFARGPKWVAKHLPERSEMAGYGGAVSAESREILLGDFGVESFIEDYALWATYATGESTATGQVYTQWVSDETRHSRALWYCLVDSGLTRRSKWMSTTTSAARTSGRSSDRRASSRHPSEVRPTR
jgi:hypothetical protein